jgi:nucleoside-diphosphate-sugar epimerase
MKILVIGNGFLGAPIIQRLELEGHEVVVFSRKPRHDINARQIVGDIFDHENLVKLLSLSPQVIIQTAWITEHPNYVNDPKNYEYAKFTKYLASRLSHADVEHYIVLGSAAEYGKQLAPVSAGVTNLTPRNLYAEQKVVTFNAVKMVLSESKIRFTWVRIFQPYGLRQDEKRLIPYLISALKQGKKIQLRDSSSILDWVTTRDIASAISWIIEKNTPLEVDVGTTIGFTNIQLLMHLEDWFGGTNQWEQLVSQSTIGSSMLIVGKDSPLIQSGWSPSDTLKTGLDWILSHENA